MSGPMRIVFSILGAIGNILSLIVFTRPSMMKTETNYILIGKFFLHILTKIIYVFNENYHSCLIFQPLQPVTYSYVSHAFPVVSVLLWKLLFTEFTQLLNFSISFPTQLAFFWLSLWLFTDIWFLPDISRVPKGNKVLPESNGLLLLLSLHHLSLAFQQCLNIHGRPIKMVCL